MNRKALFLATENAEILSFSLATDPFGPFGHAQGRLRSGQVSLIPWAQVARILF